MKTIIALVALLVSQVAYAQELPPAPEVPPGAEFVKQSFQRWDALCVVKTDPEKLEPCQVYVLRERSADPCSDADIDGDGAVGVRDYQKMALAWGCYVKSED